MIDIRSIAPEDKRLLVDALEYISSESLYRRFHATKRSFTRAELRFLTEIDGHNHLGLVAVDLKQERLAGVARAVRLPEDPSAPIPRCWSPTPTRARDWVARCSPNWIRPRRALAFAISSLTCRHPTKR